MFTEKEIAQEMKKLESLEISQVYELLDQPDYWYKLRAACHIGKTVAAKYLKPAHEVRGISESVVLEAEVDLLLSRIAEMIDDAAKVGHTFVIISEDSLYQYSHLYDIVEAALKAQGYTLESLETDADCPDGYDGLKSLCIPFYKISW